MAPISTAPCTKRPSRVLVWGLADCKCSNTLEPPKHGTFAVDYLYRNFANAFQFTRVALSSQGHRGSEDLMVFFQQFRDGKLVRLDLLSLLELLCSLQFRDLHKAHRGLR